MQQTWIQFLGREDPLEKERATYSSILAWRIPWTCKTHHWVDLTHSWLDRRDDSNNVCDSTSYRSAFNPMTAEGQQHQQNAITEAWTSELGKKGKFASKGLSWVFLSVLLSIFRLKAPLSTIVSIVCGLPLLGEDWLVILTGRFPRVNGSFWSSSSVVGGELSPVRLNMVNGCRTVKTLGIAWEVFPEGHQNAFSAPCKEN